MMGVKDLLELSDNPMKYVIIEDILSEALRMKWQHAKQEKQMLIAYHHPHDPWLSESLDICSMSLTQDRY